MNELSKRNMSGSDAVESGMRSRANDASKKWPLILGAFLILIAISIEHGASIFEIANKNLNHSSEAKSAVFNPQVLVLWVSEIGYAFIIAWVVSYFIEANARREQVESMKLDRDLIKKDVFEAVYSIKHSDVYVRAVIDRCLEARLVREDYEIFYTIDPLEGESGAEIDSGQFVIISAKIRYVARNLGSKKDRFKTVYGIPVRSGILSKYSNLTNLKVDGKIYTNEEIDRLKLESSYLEHAHDENLYEFFIEIESQKTCEVAIEASFVKELYDNEIFGFAFPTIGASLRFQMNVPGLVFGASSRLSAAELTEVRSPRGGRYGEWRVDGPILPQNGVIIWWRAAMDRGSAASPATSGV